jgi:hypothetical protein
VVSKPEEKKPNKPDPLGPLFGKLEQQPKKDDKPKSSEKRKDNSEEIEEEYMEDFESSSPEKGLESTEKILESIDKGKKEPLAPVKEALKEPTAQ